MRAKVLKVVLVVGLTLVAIANATLAARHKLYDPDENFNLDAILTFLAKGDYTTAHFGSYPFDPVISSGVLAMWPIGSVFALGGNLFDARLASIVLLLAVALPLAFWAARASGLRAFDAALFALAFTASVQFTGEQETLVINPGELWGFVYLASGILLARAHPHAAAFSWGLAAWHCKIIYLPFSAALVTATAVTRAEKAGEPILGYATLRKFSGLLLAFVAPLLVWMLLIWARYDARTVVAWLLAYVVFVVRHAAGVSLNVAPLPPFEGWRFEPNWAEPVLFLSRGFATLSAVLPLLGGPIFLVPWIVRRRMSGMPVHPTERAYLIATLAVVGLFSLWFLSGFDVTQWDKHLLPAIYASLAIAAYCILDLTRTLHARRDFVHRACMIACAIVLLASGARVIAQAMVSWQASYATACRGPQVLAPPCGQEAARKELAELTREICDTTSRLSDEDCMKQNRARFLERSAALAAANASRPEILYTAAYVVLFVQQSAYFDEDEFNRDLGRHLCALNSPLLWLYFEQADADVKTMRRSCAVSPSTPLRSSASRADA